MSDGVRFRTLYLWAFCLLLAGLMFFDKPFAYLRVGPLFISDLILLIGIALAATQLVIRGLPDHLRSVRWPLVALVAFLGYEALLTAVDVTVWGKLALRDGAVWGYGLFTLCIVCIVSPNELSRWLMRYRRLVPIYVFWAPVAILLLVFRPGNLDLPGTAISLFLFKPGDVAVHVTGAAVVLILWRFPKRLPIRWLLYLAWGVGWFLAANLSRAGMIASILSIGLAVVIRPHKGAGSLILAVASVWMLFAATGMRIEVPRHGQGAVNKEISAKNLAESFASVYCLAARTVGLSGMRCDHEVLRSRTAKWRLRWWKEVIRYTVYGPYRWTGKGFGVNLADDDGFQVRSDHGLRSPHNVFMTILARSGLPGLILFVIFIATLLVSAARAVEPGLNRSLPLVWALCYFCASLINASFDVYVENPMGGVWFWSLVGAILVWSSASYIETAKGKRSESSSSREVAV